jgi:hypothetical protein
MLVSLLVSLITLPSISSVWASRSRTARPIDMRRVDAGFQPSRHSSRRSCALLLLMTHSGAVSLEMKASAPASSDLGSNWGHYTKRQK